MKIFRSEQIKEIDTFTIKNEPVASVDLMEKAAAQLFKWYIKKNDRSKRVMIFAGPGNNGGDGLALARMLSANRYETEVYYVYFTDKTTADWQVNRSRLEKETNVRFNVLDSIDKFPLVCTDDIVIDAIFGSGLTRPAEYLAEEVIKNINMMDTTVISIDVPSGLFGEDNSTNIRENIIMADYTLSFQFPKLSFMFPENERYTGIWEVLPIGLSLQAIQNIHSPFLFMENEDVLPLLKNRNRFDHKGNFGHGLLVAGSFGKIGAAILGARAALKTGLGLITCHIPSCGNTIIQTAIPEAMLNTDISEKYISDIPDVEIYDAIGLGPGIGIEGITQKAVYNLICKYRKPMVIDADGLNILGLNKAWLKILNDNVILTPHPKEFERIAGKTDNGYARLRRQIEFSEKYKCVVVLKGANTAVSTPDGKVFFNSTGNPGMATAGSGDVLTGIILSLLAQGYTPENAAMTGVFLHGLAGDIAAQNTGLESVIATEIINNIGNAFLNIRAFEKNVTNQV